MIIPSSPLVTPPLKIHGYPTISSPLVNIDIYKKSPKSTYGICVNFPFQGQMNNRSKRKFIETLLRWKEYISLTKEMTRNVSRDLNNLISRPASLPQTSSHTSSLISNHLFMNYYFHPINSYNII